VPGSIGPAVTDAARILIPGTAKEGAPPFGLVANNADHDAWFRASLRQALDDPRPDVADVEARFVAPGAPGHSLRSGFGALGPCSRIDFPSLGCRLRLDRRTGGADRARPDRRAPVSLAPILEGSAGSAAADGLDPESWLAIAPR
jgi:hypothetical protein